MYISLCKCGLFLNVASYDMHRRRYAYTFFLNKAYQLQEFLTKSTELVIVNLGSFAVVFVSFLLAPFK